MAASVTGGKMAGGAAAHDGPDGENDGHIWQRWARDWIRRIFLRNTTVATSVLNRLRWPFVPWNATLISMDRPIQRLLLPPKPVAVFLALLLTALFGLADYATGRDVSMSAFYLVPICWACWAVGRASPRSRLRLTKLAIPTTPAASNGLAVKIHPSA